MRIQPSVLVLAVIFCGLGAATAEAKTVTHHVNTRGGNSSGPWLHEKDWGDQALGKAGYGAKNMLLGWTELITEPYAAATDKGRNSKSFLQGVGEGVWNATGQTIGGAADIATFPFTKSVVPLPEGGTSLF